MSKRIKCLNCNKVMTSINLNKISWFRISCPKCEHVMDVQIKHIDDGYSTKIRNLGYRGKG